MFAHRIFAVAFFLCGAWACATANFWIWSMPGGREQGLAIPASLVALAMCVAGVVWFVRPRLGVALAAATLIPQTFSFAFGSVAYALHLLPNYRIELSIPGTGGRSASLFVHAFSGIPRFMLRTDASYIGIGLGIELVTFAVLLLFLFTFMRQPLTGGRPN